MLAVAERCGSIPAQAEALMHVAASQIAIGAFDAAQQNIATARERITYLGPITPVAELPLS